MWTRILDANDMLQNCNEVSGAAAASCSSMVQAGCGTQYDIVYVCTDCA